VSGAHIELREDLGAYALGQLDDDRRADVEAHLGTCPAGRAHLAEIAPAAAALRDLDRGAAAVLSPPAELDDRIHRALPRPSRGGRWVPVGAAIAAAAVAAAAGAVTVVVTREEAPTVIAVPRVVVAEGVTATAGLVDHTWGLEIKLEAAGLRAGERFEVWVLGEDGRSYDAGAFLGVGGSTIACDMSSSVMLDDAASFRVIDAGGAEVIAASLPHPG
jgi:anti-sigma-K factor RskA